MRARRLYLHHFTREGQRVTIARTGRSPCEAKNAAFAALEQELTRAELPRTGWRLTEQQDITHTLPRSIR